MKMRTLGCLLLLMSFVSVVQAQDDSSPGLLVYNAWVRPTAPALGDNATPEPPLPGTVTGAFMVIRNTSDQAYTLVGASDDLAEETQLHTMSMGGGMMKMEMIDGIAIPAGETVELASGGYHVMLVNVTRDLYPDTAVSLTLTFADASGATFDLPVGVMVTDFPPEASPLIVANAQAVINADGGLDFSFSIDNQSDQDDTLIGYSTTSVMSMMDVAPVELPAGAQTNVSLNDALLMDNLLVGGSAFPLTLSFASGATQTIGMTVVDPALDATPSAAMSMDRATAEASMPMDMPMPEATKAAS